MVARLCVTVLGDEGFRGPHAVLRPRSRPHLLSINAHPNASIPGYSLAIIVSMHEKKEEEKKQRDIGGEFPRRRP